jgi:hypothetical protein
MKIKQILSEAKELDYVSASKVFNSKIKSMGIKARPLQPGDLESAEENRNGDKLIELGVVKIDTSKLGAMSPVFEKAQVEVKALYGKPDEKSGPVIVMLLEWNWKHPSGSNGYSIRDSFFNGKWVGY